MRKNAGASLVDLGDGVVAVEFHSKMNAIGGDTIQMLQEGVREASKDSRVVGGTRVLFSRRKPHARALEAQEENGTRSI